MKTMLAMNSYILAIQRITDQRIGQIIMNAVPHPLNQDLFYISDADLVYALRKYLEFLKKG